MKIEGVTIHNSFSFKNQDEHENPLDKECNGALVIEKNELAPVDLMKLGYKRIIKEDNFRFDPLFNVVKENIIDNIKEKAIEKSFKEAVEGSYKCIIKNNEHLANIRGHSDVYLGNTLDNTSNKVTGVARWVKNESTLAIPSTAQIISNAFNGVSIITGQYFMAEINSKLKLIQEDIVGLHGLIESIKESELKAALFELNNICNHLEYSKKSELRVQTDLVSVANILATAQNCIILYEKQIKQISNSANKNDKEKTLKKNIDSINHYIKLYKLAMYIYNSAIIVKIELLRNIESSELQLFYDGLVDNKKRYEELYLKVSRWSQYYINTNTSLNKNEKEQMLVELGGWGLASFGLGLANLAVGVAVKNAIHERYENIKEKKKEYEESQRKNFIQLDKMENVDSVINTLQSNLQLLDNDIEIVKVDEEYYYRYLPRTDLD